jgi:hypothetical protein
MNRHITVGLGMAVVFDLVEPLDRRPAPHRPAGRVVAKSTPANRPWVSRGLPTAPMPEAGTGYCGGACASLVLGKCGGPLSPKAASSDNKFARL